LIFGLAGLVVIVSGGQALGGDLNVTLMGLGSGLTYACVILCLRALRAEAPQWLAVQNHLGSALCLAAAMAIWNGTAYWVDWITAPTWRQLAFLAVFGSVQMGLPYWLFARGLRTVSPQEAGAITLLEPMLNPVWAYLISPEREAPSSATWVGGGLILGALAYRYLPGQKSRINHRGTEAQRRPEDSSQGKAGLGPLS
jgi:drug/metabolite transporter (DMT)-like permease